MCHYKNLNTKDSRRNKISEKKVITYAKTNSQKALNPYL